MKAAQLSRQELHAERLARREAQEARVEAWCVEERARFPKTRARLEAWCADMLRRYPGATRVSLAAAYGHAVVQVGQVTVSATTVSGAMHFRAGEGLYAGYSLDRLVATLDGKSPPLALKSALEWEGRPRPSEMIPLYVKQEVARRLAREQRRLQPGDDDEWSSDSSAEDSDEEADAWLKRR